MVLSAGSPIQWRTWSDATFADAQKEDKPILLRLSAVWCHWCHVMDSTSDHQPEAVRLLNEKYIPVRVDIDQYPDVSERYNFGGFPTSAFLTPQGDVITGGTYIPPEDFVKLLTSVAEAYGTQKEEIRRRVAEVERHEDSHRAPEAKKSRGAPGGSATAAQKILDSVATSLLVNFDAEHGGFGSAPKFPQPAAVELALRLHQDQQGKEYATVVRKTLDAMRASGLWDSQEQGFFRYSTTAAWTVPHFEKMLEGNAGLMGAYAAAGGAFQNGEWLGVVRDQHAYLSKTLRDPKAELYYGSQDADEAYYALPLKERAQRSLPYVDRTFYTDWGAQMAHADLEAFVATGDAALREAGLGAVDALVARHASPADGVFHFSTATRAPERTGLFTDHVHLLRALLRAHEVTGDPRYLRTAESVYETAHRSMWDRANHRFRDRAATGRELGRVGRPRFSIIENGVAARCLLRLRHFAAKASYGQTAEAILGSHEPDMDRWGIFGAEMGLAALEFLRPPLVVHVVAPPAQAAPFLREAARIPYPFLLTRVLDEETGRPVAAQQGISLPKTPAAFACAGSACSRLFKPGEAFAEEAARLARAAPVQKV